MTTTAPLDPPVASPVATTAAPYDRGEQAERLTAALVDAAADVQLFAREDRNYSPRLKEAVARRDALMTEASRAMVGGPIQPRRR